MCALLRSGDGGAAKLASREPQREGERGRERGRERERERERVSKSESERGVAASGAVGSGAVAIEGVGEGRRGRGVGEGAHPSWRERRSSGRPSDEFVPRDGEPPLCLWLRSDSRTSSLGRQGPHSLRYTHLARAKQSKERTKITKSKKEGKKKTKSQR
jgi:hypothetical protein